MSKPIILQTFTGATTANTATSVAATSTNNCTKGSVLVVGFGAGTLALTTLTDSLGNTYTKVISDITFSDDEIWYAVNKFDGPNVITGTFTAEAATLIVFEVANADITNPIDKSVANKGDGVTSNTPTATTATTTQGSEIVIAFTTFFSGAGTDLPTVGTGYSGLVVVNSTPTTGQNVSSGMQYKLVDAKAAQTATFGLAFTTTTWEITVVTIRASNTAQPNRRLRPHLFSPGLAR